VTIYINNALEEKIKTRAGSLNISLSKLISSVLEQQFNNQWHPDTQKLVGSWQDFPEIEQIREATANDVEKESF
jgi:hypothetical protein